MIVYTDGGRNKYGSYGSFVIENDDETTIALHRLIFGEDINTNNAAEYATILEALKYCRAKKFKTLTIYSDSMLAIRQIRKEWRIGPVHLLELAQKVWEALEYFDKVDFQHKPRKYIVAKLGH